MAEQQEKSRAKRMQEQSAPGARKKEDPLVRATIRTQTGFEYHLKKPASVLRAMIDPDVSDALIEVPVPVNMASSVKHRYIHTNQIAELDLHDELEM